MMDFVPSPSEEQSQDSTLGSLRSRLLRGVWAATFYYLLPFFGFLGAADLCYDLLGFSTVVSLAAGLTFGYLAWKARPRSPAQSWGIYVQHLAGTALVAASPLIAFTAVFWPLSYSSRFPALLPGLFAAGLVFYVAKDWNPWKTPETPVNRPRNGQAEGEKVDTLIKTITFEVRDSSRP